MSATEQNPHFAGALSLVELIPRKQVCFVWPTDHTYEQAEVVSVDIEEESSVALQFVESADVESFSTEDIGVTRGIHGWSESAYVSEPDNPALEHYTRESHATHNSKGNTPPNMEG